MYWNFIKYIFLFTLLSTLLSCSKELGVLELSGYESASAFAAKRNINLTFGSQFDVDGDDIELSWDSFAGDFENYNEDYQIILYTDSDCSTGALDQGNTSSTDTDDNEIIDSIPDGTYYATVTGFDAEGDSVTSNCSTNSITVDTTPPTVSSVSFTTADGTYSTISPVADTINLQVTFDEAVTVDTAVGTPRVELETGFSDDDAIYNSGTTTTTLNFSYDVNLGDFNPDLDYTSTSALTLSGGTIRDAAGNDAVLTLPAVGTLAAAHAIEIDAYQRVAQVTAAGGHTCMLTTYGNVYCVGKNDNGQLGINSTINQVAWTQVDSSNLAANDTFTELSSSGDTSCGITDTDKVFCWGNNTAGQLGFDDSGAVGITSPLLVPTEMDLSALGAETPKRVATAGTATCVYDSGNDVYCTGNDTFGQLGNDTSTTSDQETLVSIDTTSLTAAGATITDVYGGADKLCVTANDNKAYCWGSNNNYGLGKGPVVSSDFIPNVQVDPTSGNMTKIASSEGSHGCGLSDDNSSGSFLYCWGLDANGQLGDDSSAANQAGPTVVDETNLGTESFNRLADSMGIAHSCALTDEDNIWCWGRASVGALGNSSPLLTSPDQLIPTTQVDDSALDTSDPGNPEIFTSVELGADHSCAISNFGNLFCWGGNGDSQLGLGDTTDRIIPVKVDLDAINP